MNINLSGNLSENYLIRWSHNFYWKDLMPNRLCNYLFELCQTFNRFYDQVPILKEEKIKISSLIMWPNCKNTKIKLRAFRNWNFRKNVMNDFDPLNNLFPKPREEIINMQSYSAPLENRRNLPA